MKKLDKLVFSAFISPFFLTFLVVVFILLNIQMLKYYDDIIGKGLEWGLIAQLLLYFAIFTTPTALPLSVLLSSLIAFGNLGEHFELTAIKSSGVSLVRVLRPIFFFVVFLTGVAFYANNTLVPFAALEAYSLLYDIKQKKPALDLREGAFYNGIDNISIKVNKKYPDGVTLKDVVVYDHRKRDGNREVTIADSGKMYTILNERYLKFELFNGYNYSEGTGNERDLTGKNRHGVETLRRSKFGKSQVVFDLSSFLLDRTEKKWFQSNRIMRNMRELEYDIDSMQRDIMSQRVAHYMYSPAFFVYLDDGDSLIIPPDLYEFKKQRDSISRIPPVIYTPADVGIETVPPQADTLRSPDKTRSESIDNQTVKPKRKLRPPEEQPRPRIRPGKKQPRLLKPVVDSTMSANNVPPSVKSQISKPIDSTLVVSADTLRKKPATAADRVAEMKVKVDSVMNIPPDRHHYEAAANAARLVKSQLSNVNTSIENYTKEEIGFNVQWHKIIASSFACIAMFLIGAPLGAIIKKGGLGMPFLVSIIFFIIYYVLTMQGEKLAKQETVSVAFGVWMADFILLTIGLFFLRQARADARLFEADFYNVVYDKAKTWLQNRRKRTFAKHI